jgi:hypothetical protein
MPLLDESMENLTCDVVIDEERFRGDLNVYRILLHILTCMPIQA